MLRGAFGCFAAGVPRVLQESIEDQQALDYNGSRVN